MIRLALFDIDGTLIRTGGAGVKAFARAFVEEFGVHGADKLNFAGRTDSSLVRDVFGLHRIEPNETHLGRFFAAYLHWLEHFLPQHQGRVCAGVHDFLCQLRALPEPPVIGLLTGNIRRGAEIKLEHYGLWREFALGGFADDHVDRNHIAAAAHRRGEDHLKRRLHGHEVLVVGDTPHDIRCGRAIRAKVLAVATGGSSLEELRRHQPDWAVPDLTHISAREVCGLAAA